MKYRDNMTDEEIHQLLAECDVLESHMARAQQADEANAHAFPVPDEWADEYRELRRAALNHRGEP